MLAKRANRKAALGSKIEGKLFVFLFLAVATTLTGTARAQNCLTSDEMDAPTRQALELAAQRYFALAASGDVAALKRSSTAGVAEAFAATAAAVQASQANLATTKPALHSVFALTVEDQAPGPITAQRKEFLCGAFGKAGQTASSAVFVLDNLSAGRYGVAILDATRSGGGTADATKNEPYVVSFVLQQVAGEWRLAGFYARPAQSAGHGSEWFTERAQAFVGKSQKHNAWFYFQEARNLATTVPFMSTRETDALYDEAQKIMPADLPGAAASELLAGGKTYQLKSIFSYAAAEGVNLVVKYDSADVSDATRTYAANQAVARALVAKWPELRDGFAAIVARATEASGKDYGTLVEMGDLK